MRAVLNENLPIEYKRELGTNGLNKTEIITVTGGKGGTGKSLVALCISSFLSKMGFKILLLDCDVDSPNIALLYKTKLKNKMPVTSFYPVFNEQRCTFCGKCSFACLHKAILAVKNKLPHLYLNLCEGCEACKIVCPYDAIDDGSKLLGWSWEGKIENIDIISGELKINEVNTAAVVKAVKKRAFERNNQEHHDFIITDTSPGAHCDVIRSLIGSDMAIAVTEPTPFGYHDLELIIRLINKMSIPSQIVINRSDLVDGNWFSEIDRLAKLYNSHILGSIPLDQKILEKYVNSDLLNINENISLGFRKIYEITEKILTYFNI